MGGERQGEEPSLTAFATDLVAKRKPGKAHSTRGRAVNKEGSLYKVGKFLTLFL